MRILLAMSFLSVVTSGLAEAQQAPVTTREVARIDSIFTAYASAGSPGCALGISRRDTVVLERAWGGANLEHSIAITPGTIFEAGSVSKQFTAAAIFRLAQLGRLSLDDDARKYVPELPAYDAPITIRHLVNHTSGLRDWGTVMAIAGWPRGTRTYTHAHVLEIIARQRALNYAVGSEYLYSNSNYNLLAIIAERVSGKTLPEFTRTEIFEPLGMTRSGWRDDYTRIVPGRAQAYGGSGSNWRLQMPFENVYGNSSLLTTVGDLLRWSANFGNGRVGGRDFIAMQERRGQLKSGRQISYAGGVVVSSYRGTREIFHDGSTAGYRAFLGRYPDAGYSIALLCNAGSVNPTSIAHRVMDVFLPSPVQAASQRRDTIGVAVAPTALARVAGTYRHIASDEPMQIGVVNGRLRIVDGPDLVSISDRQFTTSSGRTRFVFENTPAAEARMLVIVEEDTSIYVPAAPANITSPADYTGSFRSDEADVTLGVIAADGKLFLSRRPAARIAMVPVYADGFTAQGTLLKFTRAANGRVNGMLVTSGRARNIRFERIGDQLR